ncbi:MAG: C39 family peptidase [Oscillospiraceae bacterium]|nr:C39 family peptidase [Oscillospiraceae bacterium]
MILHIKRTAAFLLAVILIFGSFAGCEMIEPSIALTGDAPYQIPELVGIYRARDINAEIEKYCTPIIDDLKSGNSQTEEAAMAYRFEKADGGYVLSSWLEGADGQQIPLGDIVIKNGSGRVPEYSGGEYISDPVLLSGMMTALKIGYDVNFSRMPNMVTAETAKEMLVRYMEWSCGRVIDSSTVKNSKITDQNVRKLLAANSDFGNIYYENGTEISAKAAVESRALVQWISEVLPWIAFESYGMSSKGFTMQQYFDLLELYVSLYSPTSSEEKFGDRVKLNDTMIKNAEKWNTFTASLDVKTAVKESILNSTTAITRQELANTSIDIVDKFLYKTTNDERYTDIDDTTNHKAQKSVYLGLVKEFPSGGMFSPLYKPRYYEMSDYCYDMAKLMFEYVTGENDNRRSEYSDYISFADMIVAIDKLEGYFSSFTKVDSTQYKSANNTREYDWYLNQYSTGEYSDVNCMPTMSAMAILWHTQNADVTPAQLRGLFVKDFKGGWYMEQVASCLKRYKVTYKYREAKLNNMLEDLDSGNIILTQMSEAKPENDGHCEIIYGYEKVGDSVVFLVNDPGVSSLTREDGCGFGEALRLDSEYVLYTIDRMTYQYVAVYPKGA